MADDLIQIGIQVDTRSLVDAQKKLKSFQNQLSSGNTVLGLTRAISSVEKNIEELTKAQNRGLLSNRSFSQGLLEQRKALEAMGMSSYMARKRVQELANALRDQQAAKRAAQAADEAARATQRLADRQRELRMRFQEGYAQFARQREAMRSLREAYRTGIITLQQYEAQLARIRTANLGNVAGTNNLGVAMQQTGYQVGDFMVQIQGGTNVMVAFGQQATQLVGVLYLLPPATLAATRSIMGLSVSVGFLVMSLGIILPIATAIGAYFMRMSGSAKKLSDNLNELTSSSDKLKQTFEIIEDKELDQTFGNLTDEVRSLSSAMLTLDSNAQLKNLTAFLDKAEGAASAGVFTRLYEGLTTAPFNDPTTIMANTIAAFTTGAAVVDEKEFAKLGFGIGRDQYLEYIKGLKAAANQGNREEVVRLFSELIEGAGSDLTTSGYKLADGYRQAAIDLAEVGALMDGSADAAVRLAEAQERFAEYEGKRMALEDELAMAQEIAKFGEDSNQVAKLALEQRISAFDRNINQLVSNNKLEWFRGELLKATNAELARSESSYETIEDKIKRISSEIEAATQFKLSTVFETASRAIDGMNSRLGVTLSQLGGIMSSINSVLIDTVSVQAESEALAAGKSATEAANAARIAREITTLTGTRNAEDLTLAQAAAITALTEALERNGVARDKLKAQQDALRDAEKKSKKEQKDLVKSFEKQLDLQRQLVGQSEAYIAVRKALGDSYDKVDPKRIRSLEIQYEQTQKLIEQEEAVQGVISGIADSWAKFVSEGFKDFKGFAQSVFNVFKNLLVQMIATAAKNKILISLGMGGSVAGTAASAAAGSAAGTAAGSAAAAGTAAAGYANFAAGVGSTMGTAAGTAAAGTAAGSTTMFAIGAAAPYILAAVLIIGLLSKKVTTSLKEIDSGVSGMVKGFDVAIKNFSVIEKTVTTSRFFGLSKKKSVSTETVEQDAPDSPLIAAVGEIQQSVLTAAEAFGFGADAFKDFSYEFKLSLMGLSDDQKVQKINEELTRMGDAFADMLPHFSSMNELLEAAEHRYQIENRMLEALGRSTEVVIRNRERELAATHALNRGLLQATFDLEDANAAVSAAMDGLRRAIDAEKDRLRSAFDGIVEAIRNSFELVIKDLRDKLSLANEAVNRSRSIFNQLESALSGRSVTSDIGQTFARREGALSFIRGGDFSDEKKLEEALGVVSEPTEGLFSSFIEYARDFARTSLTLEEAKNVAKVQLTADEQQVLLLEQQIVDADRNLEQQLANADSNLEQQLAALDQQYQVEVDQYNALLGIDTSVKSVGDAIATLRGATEALASAQAAAKAAQTSGGGFGGGSIDQFSTGKKYQGFDLLDVGGAAGLLQAAGLTGVSTSGKTGLQIAQDIANATGQAVQLDAASRVQQFARGGMFDGGMRLVGEEGPELEVTGPSRIYSKQQTKELLRGGDSNEGEGLRAEVSEMRQELRQLLIANNKYTKRSYDLYNKWDIDGLPAERT
jgi:hypothetical protein